MQKPRRKYSKERLIEAVQNSSSWMGVIRFFGLKMTGGNHVAFQSRVNEYGIDTSHFTGAGWAKGHTAKSHPSIQRISVKRTWSDKHILCVNSPAWVKGHTLKPRMIKAGKLYECATPECLVKAQWLGNPIPLHVDHINGINNDNRLENLRFLCPNCHQQTPTWGNKNIRRGSQ